MTIVLFYTPTDPGRAAVEIAIHEAAAHDRALVVVNARRGGALVESGVAPDEELYAIVEKAREAGVTAAIDQPANTDIVEAVLESAVRHRADAIVIGIRHRSAVGKLLLGSTAQHILLNAPCPVIAVKPQR